MTTQPAAAEDHADLLALAFTKLAPRPKKVEDTGLSRTFLAELASKHLFDAGVITVPELTKRMALAGPIVEDILLFMRQEARVEVLANAEGGALRYGLTDRGRAQAQDAFARGGYVGPAPLPLNAYRALVDVQSIHDQTVTRDRMRAAYQDVVLKDEVVDQLGPALNSGRAIFIYGHAGTGKTFITQRFTRLFQSEILVPHAIAINETVVPVFDPVIHKRSAAGADDGLRLDGGHDPRLVRTQRPVVISGGELTVDMLEMHFDPNDKVYQPPLQLKANNGIFIIDDMGRQRSAPEVIFNRWIIPMEEREDYLSLGAGRHFSVPFDVVLVFSTNMHPLDLADEAFLRRIGYKIEFLPLDEQEYEQVWRGACADIGVDFDRPLLEFVLSELYPTQKIPLLPCHPRDLLGIAADQAAYLGRSKQLSESIMRWAWSNYFVSMANASHD